jgi:hypothetical protein
VRELCPEFPGTPQAMHWSVRDPAREARTDDDSLPFERAAVELETRVGFLLEAIEHTTDTQEASEHAANHRPARRPATQKAPLGPATVKGG